MSTRSRTAGRCRRYRTRRSSARRADECHRPAGDSRPRERPTRPHRPRDPPQRSLQVLPLGVDLGTVHITTSLDNPVQTCRHPHHPWVQRKCNGRQTERAPESQNFIQRVLRFFVFFKCTMRVEQVHLVHVPESVKRVQSSDTPPPHDARLTSAGRRTEPFKARTNQPSKLTLFVFGLDTFFS